MKVAVGINLICASFSIICACAATRWTASLRRRAVARVVALALVVFAASAALLVPARQVVAAPAAVALAYSSPKSPIYPATNAGNAPPIESIPCPIHKPDGKGDQVDTDMAKGASALAVGDLDHTRKGIVHYNNAFNATSSSDPRHRQAAEGMACGFSRKAELEAQLIAAQVNSESKGPQATPIAGSPVITDVVARLPLQDIEAFMNTDLDIALRLLALSTPRPRLIEWGVALRCKTAAITPDGPAPLATCPRQVQHQQLVLLQMTYTARQNLNSPATAQVTVRDGLGEENGIEEIVWFTLGGQEKIFYLYDDKDADVNDDRLVQKITFDLPSPTTYRYSFKAKTFFITPTQILDRPGKGMLAADGKTYNLVVTNDRASDVGLGTYAGPR